MTYLLGSPMFHISRHDLGARVTLIPKVPSNLASSECRHTPRVCFAPTLDQCMIGIVGYGVSVPITILGAFLTLVSNHLSPAVYVTHETLYKPDRVSDYCITHEEWALDPITVDRVGYIDCLAMLQQRTVNICDKPNWVSLTDHEIGDYMSDDERDTLLKVLDTCQ